MEHLKRLITSKNKTIIGIASIVLNMMMPVLFISYGYGLIFALIGIIPAIFLMIPEDIKSSKSLSVLSLP